MSFAGEVQRLVSIHRALSTHTVISEAIRIHHRASNWNNKTAVAAVAAVPISLFPDFFPTQSWSISRKRFHVDYALASGERNHGGEGQYPPKTWVWAASCSQESLAVASCRSLTYRV